MFGLINKLSAAADKRDELISILLAGTHNMPGCLHYIISKDLDDATALWIFEVWENEAAHKASLSLPSVQEAIGAGRAFITGMDAIAKTEPVGGVGLK